MGRLFSISVTGHQMLPARQVELGHQVIQVEQVRRKQQARRWTGCLEKKNLKKDLNKYVNQSLEMKEKNKH